MTKNAVIKEDFFRWLEELEVSLDDFKEWYASEFQNVSIGTLRRMIGRMGKIAEDERLGPNRRMLAAYQCSYWSAKIAGDTNEQALLASVILGEFVNRNGFKLYDQATTPGVGQTDGTGHSKLEISALTNLKEAFSVMKDNLKEEGFLPDYDDTSTIQSEQD